MAWVHTTTYCSNSIFSIQNFLYILHLIVCSKATPLPSEHSWAQWLRVYTWSLIVFESPHMLIIEPIVLRNLDWCWETGLYQEAFVQDFNLYQVIKQRQGIPISESTIRDWTFQILQGLEYMHRAGFFHRDLKPGELCFSERWMYQQETLDWVFECVATQEPRNKSVSLNEFLSDQFPI